MTKPLEKIKKTNNTPRHVSRVAAVQALYQIEQTSEHVKSVIRDMIESGFSTLSSEGYVKPEISFFEDLVQNTTLRQSEFDAIIQKYLADNWRLERLASIVRTILRLGAYELSSCLTVPKTVVLNEYIEITKAFFESHSEPAFVNGILDKMANEIRG